MFVENLTGFAPQIPSPWITEIWVNFALPCATFIMLCVMTFLVQQFVSGYGKWTQLKIPFLLLLFVTPAHLRGSMLINGQCLVAVLLKRRERGGGGGVRARETNINWR